MKCNHIVLPCTIASKETSPFNTFAIADCGATASFIDSSFAQLHGLKFSLLQYPRDLTVADGRTISSGAITHTVRIAFALGAHREVFKLFVTRLGQYPVVLGLPWLQKHDPRICFKHNTITFNSEHCLEHCITTHQAMTICGADNVFDSLHEHETHEVHEIHETTPKTYETRRSTATAMPCSNTTTVAIQTHKTRRSTPKPRYSPCSSHQINMADCTRKMNRELTLLDNTIVTKSTGTARTPTEYTGVARNFIEDITSTASRPLDISIIGAAPFNHLVQRS